MMPNQSPLNAIFPRALCLPPIPKPVPGKSELSLALELRCRTVVIQEERVGIFARVLSEGAMPLKPAIEPGRWYVRDELPTPSIVLFENVRS